MEKSEIIARPYRDDLPLIMRQSMRGHENYFKDAIKKGTCQLWEVDEGKAHFITRFELQNGIMIMVVCCYEGQDIFETSKQIIEQARRAGVHFMRYHTWRKGMVKLGKRLGFKIHETRPDGEIVLIKNLYLNEVK